MCRRTPRGPIRCCSRARRTAPSRTASTTIPLPTGRSTNYAKEKFIFVIQDVRGRYGSEGDFVHCVRTIRKRAADDIDESTDTYDTIDWLVKNVPNNNGKVGMMGISYPGFYTAAGMIDAHPALKSRLAAGAGRPIGSSATTFITTARFYLPHALRFLSFFGQPLRRADSRAVAQPFDYETPDGYEFYLQHGPLAERRQDALQGQESRSGTS